MTRISKLFVAAFFITKGSWGRVTLETISSNIQVNFWFVSVMKYYIVVKNKMI